MVKRKDYIELLDLLYQWGKLLSTEEKEQIVKAWLKKDKNSAKIFDTWILEPLGIAVKEAEETQENQKKSADSLKRAH